MTTFSDRDGNYPVLNSAMMLVAPGRGFNSYFEMPFRKHCRITMENRGEKAETLFYMISGWYGEIPENSGYFHATYRQEHPVQKGRSYVIFDESLARAFFAGVTLASGMNGHNTHGWRRTPKCISIFRRHIHDELHGTEWDSASAPARMALAMTFTSTATRRSAGFIRACMRFWATRRKWWRIHKSVFMLPSAGT